MSDSVEERIAQRRAEEDRLRARLANLDLDGPYRFQSGDFVSSMFGGGALVYAICTRCGAMVRLEDPMETGDSPAIERGVKLHTDWHREVSA